MRPITGIIRFIKKEAKNLKSILYYAEAELRARNFKTFFKRVFEVMRKVFDAREQAFSTAWSGEVKTEFNDKSAACEVIPTSRGGEPLPQVFVSRAYKFKDKMLGISEEVSSGNRRLRKIVYVLPKNYKNLAVKTDFFYRQSGVKIIFVLPRKGSIKISYEL